MWYLNSPKRILIFAGVVTALAISIIVIANFIQYTEGLPEIETVVDKQLAQIISDSRGLNGLEILGRVRVRTTKYRNRLSGFFEYEARRSGTPVQIRVDWVQVQDAVSITRVVLSKNDSNPEIVWPVNEPTRNP